MFDVFGDHRAEMASVIRPTKDPMLFVAPARLALAKIEQQLSGQFDAPFKLKDALAPMQKDYDYIVIDTPPALGILTVNAMVASTHSGRAHSGRLFRHRGHRRSARNLRAHPRAAQSRPEGSRRGDHAFR